MNKEKKDNVGKKEEEDLKKIANDRIKDLKEKENIDDATRAINPTKGRKSK